MLQLTVTLDHHNIVSFHICAKFEKYPQSFHETLCSQELGGRTTKNTCMEM